jgi:hypothetical protein
VKPSPVALRALALEARAALTVLEQASEPARVGSLVVSGMLAEQLARELAAGARTGSVVIGDEVALRGAAVAVRVIAGDPSDADDAFVRAADDALVPVVLVQLWPQADWRAPFVLSPFVVECAAGKGFPVPEIAARIAEATEDAPALAARLPALEESVRSATVRSAVLRTALFALLARGPGSRAVLAAEQVRALAQLRALSPPAEPDPRAAVVGAAAGTIALGYALRSLARAARGAIPPRLADAAVAGAGTWAITRLARELEARLQP